MLKLTWTPPLTKIHFDTVGAVIRDATGNFIAASNDKLGFVQDPLTAEAYGLKHEVLLAHTLGCNRIIMCSDSMEVVETMRNGAHAQGVAADIFDDCYHLSTEFLKIQFDHEKREANAIAHELASMAKGSSQSTNIFTTSVDFRFNFDS
jgi:isoaspartyl peptidase/L-asparaginase-like protein (Ntn-hydrolase superfamily)